MHEGVTDDNIDDEKACIEYMVEKLKKAKTIREREGETARKSEGKTADVVDIEGLKDIKVEDETPSKIEILDIARTATPIIPGKSPEGTDGEEEDSESSDTDSTW